MTTKKTLNYHYLPYKAFLKMVKMRTGIPEQYIRDILRAIPEVLRQELKVGATLRTPLGNFNNRVISSYNKKLPTGQETKTKNLMLITLKSGKRLKIHVDDEDIASFLKDASVSGE